MTLIYGPHQKVENSGTTLKYVKALEGVQGFLMVRVARIYDIPIFYLIPPLKPCLHITTFHATGAIKLNILIMSTNLSLVWKFLKAISKPSH